MTKEGYDNFCKLGTVSHSDNLPAGLTAVRQVKALFLFLTGLTNLNGRFSTFPNTRLLANTLFYKML